MITAQALHVQPMILKQHANRETGYQAEQFA